MAHLRRIGLVRERIEDIGDIRFLIELRPAERSGAVFEPLIICHLEILTKQMLLKQLLETK